MIAASSRALVTGWDGFTGRHLIPRLKASCHVAGVASGSSFGFDGAGPGLDLRDADSVREVVRRVRPDVVIHLAAISFVPDAAEGDVYSINVSGTRNLLAALAESEVSPRSVLLPSSAAVYGDAEGEPIRETASFAPLNDYAVSKVAMEFMARLWMDRLPITIVRPFNYTGLGQSARFVVPKIVSHFKARAERIELGNIDVRRDFSDVRDVVEAYLALASGGFAGETFNLCSGVAYSLRDILGLMEGIAGYSPSVSINPQFVREKDASILVGDPAYRIGKTGIAMGVPLVQTLEWMYAGPRAADPSNNN